MPRVALIELNSMDLFAKSQPAHCLSNFPGPEKKLAPRHSLFLLEHRLLPATIASRAISTQRFALAIRGRAARSTS
jgi:hypothetical protein